MSDRKLTDGWPYITLDVCGVRLPFRQLGMPGARRKLLSDLAAAQAEGLDLLRAAQADDATDADRAGFERSQLLIEGSVGAYLMRLWVGPRMPTQDLVDADRTAEASALHFKGADHAGCWVRVRVRPVRRLRADLRDPVQVHRRDHFAAPTRSGRPFRG